MGRRSAGGGKKEEVAHRPESSNPSLEREEFHLEMQTNAANLSSSRKKAKNQIVIVRRSERLQNSVLHAQNQDIPPVIEDIDVSESEKEDEPKVHKDEKLQGPALKSKATKRSFFSQIPWEDDVRYNSLYIESQKKIEALTEENYQLGKKLENALGKLEAYEKGTRVFSEILEKLKDVILISNVTKATETAINLSSQAILGAVSSPNVVIEPITSPAKRKRPAKVTRRN